KLVGGRVRGDGGVDIAEAATLRNALPGQITLAVSSELVRDLRDSQASAAVVPVGFPDVPLPLIEVDDVECAFSQIVAHFRPPRCLTIPASPSPSLPDSARVGPGTQIDPSARIGQDVVIGARCRIHAGVVVGDGTIIGDDTVLFPNVVLYENTRIGSRVLIHAGAVIGAYGFGYQTREGRHHLSAQLGHVEIGDDVEIGACTTIDRGTYDATVIGEGTKIDNHVMIGHNCSVGRHNLICSLAGIAGSCRTGDYVVLAGQAGLSDHIDLGDGARVAAKSGVMQDIPAGETFAGLPAMPEKEFWRMWVTVTRLPELRKKLKELEREVAALRGRLSENRDAA
ncbi:MAG TPA: UDP-3-O-(3-hydroxymyristoyl)glucosamine N-acyltransferase, partial [Planctomycetaceae bacterium]|nr:UDP-3-O-(3-hydroxymyristoyl)glucosamine N-acyltransferase [Planctomycetaceae bacterium]